MASGDKRCTGARVKLACYFAGLITLQLLPLSVHAGVFGEGYSSSAPGTPASISYRIFTIYTRQEVCEESATPSELRILPNPILLKIGDRIHRSNTDSQVSELVVEAYGPSGEFIPAVPIIVSTVDVQNVTSTRADLDYLEAVKPGEDDLEVSWACPEPTGRGVAAQVRIIVSD